MAGKEIILIVGVAGHWGSQVTARLVDELGKQVLGLDAIEPEPEIPGLDFIPADIRNPQLPALLKEERVDTVIHLAFAASARPNKAAHDLNVTGTTKLLDACAEAGVRRILLKSSTDVYGARPGNPAFLPEGHALRGSQRYGYVRDLIEIEKYCQGFRHRTPELEMTILRFANIVGPTADTPMTRFLRSASMPSLLGFDPLMQIVHEADVVNALVHAALNDVPGVFNVAAEDVLPLNKIRGLAGKAHISVPHPLAYWALGVGRNRAQRFGRHLPMDPDYLRYSLVCDLTSMREDLAFEPHYTAEETLQQFAEQNRMRTYLPQSAILARSEEHLRDIIEQRQQVRERQVATTATGEGADND